MTFEQELKEKIPLQELRRERDEKLEKLNKRTKKLEELKGTGELNEKETQEIEEEIENKRRQTRSEYSSYDLNELSIDLDLDKNEIESLSYRFGTGWEGDKILKRLRKVSDLLQGYDAEVEIEADQKKDELEEVRIKAEFGRETGEKFTYLDRVISLKIREDSFSYASLDLYDDFDLFPSLYKVIKGEEFPWE